MYKELEDLLPSLFEIVGFAGEYAKEKSKDNKNIKIKQDKTPVTEVDIYLSNLLIEKLSNLTPNIPVLSEEKSDIPLSTREKWDKYWLIDPIDGTKEFIKQTNYFSTIVALVENNQPILGMVYMPMSNTFYYAIKGYGAYKKTKDNVEKIKTKHNSEQKLDILISNSANSEEVLSKLNPIYQYNLTKLGSCAIKSCFVAEGLYDGYLCGYPTGEWDSGASEIIIKEAGGILLNIDLQPLTYNQRDNFVNPPFIVLGDKNNIDLVSTYK